MKKTYMKPTAEVMSINMQHFMAASGNGGLVFDDNDMSGTGSLPDVSADDGIDALTRKILGF